LKVARHNWQTPHFGAIAVRRGCDDVLDPRWISADTFRTRHTVEREINVVVQQLKRIAAASPIDRQLQTWRISQIFTRNRYIVQSLPKSISPGGNTKLNESTVKAEETAPVDDVVPKENDTNVLESHCAIA
jgi:hypothetical protein